MRWTGRGAGLGWPPLRSIRPLVAALAVIAVLALVATLLALRGPGDEVSFGTIGAGGEVEAPPSSPSTPQSAPADFDEVIADLTAFVEEERGLSFLRPVQVNRLDDEEFEQEIERRIREDEATDRPEAEAAEVTLRALGLLEPDVDLYDIQIDLFQSGVLGFYDPETDELYIRGTEPTPYVRQTIAHELVHALDDQHFELHRPEIDDADDESGFGFSALVEGNAVVIDEAFERQLSDAERAQLREEEEAFAAGVDVDAFPEILLIDISAPYELGPDLVAALLDAGGRERLDAAFALPPTTSEQVLDPSLFLAGEAAVPVTAPAADGEVVDQGSFGQFYLLALVSGAVDSATAREAAIGWGGDAYVSWRDGDRSCARIAFAGDSPADAAEIADALSEWASAQPDASVDDGGDAVVLTSCR